MFGNRSVPAQARLLDVGEQIGGVTRKDGMPHAKFQYPVEVRVDGQPPVQAVASGMACVICPPQVGDILNVEYEAKKATASFDVSTDPRYDPAKSKQRALDRMSAERAAMKALQNGARGLAMATSIVLGSKFDGLVVEQTFVHVTPEVGEQFDAVISHSTFARMSAPSGEKDARIGESRPVVFDPTDRTKIDWRLSQGPVLLWRVPANCPQCGGPVDQSRASVAEHPTCEHCHQPLPVQPA